MAKNPLNPARSGRPTRQQLKEYRERGKEGTYEVLTQATTVRVYRVKADSLEHARAKLLEALWNDDEIPGELIDVDEPCGEELV